MSVVSNTSPINYLLLIGQIDLLPQLFRQIVIPQIVHQELSDTKAPEVVQSWLASPPDWLKIQSSNQNLEPIVELLDPGESAAILLAQEINADLLLLDDMKARQIARSRSLNVTGTLGILDQAATLQLIELPGVIERLQSTSFWASERLYQVLLEKHAR